jgi:AraC-like DNA-binding protein
MNAPSRLHAPLARHSLLRSRDLGEVETLYRSKGLSFEVLSGAPDVTVNAAYLPNVHVSYLSYGAAARVRFAAEREEHWLALPVRGGLESVTRDGVSALAPGAAAIASPGRECAMRSELGGARFGLAIKRDALARQLSTLLGEAVEGDVVFEPVLDASAGRGRVVAEHLRLLVRELDADDSLLRNPLMATQFEQSIMTALLLAHRHSHSGALARRQGGPAPRDLKRALDYIHANLDQPLAVADLVAVAGVPGRTLYKHFQDFKGASPMAYVRQARLAKVREDLLNAASCTRVTQVAGRWGFDHLGRFAGEYRRRFGEAPSTTLRRR